MSKPGSQRDPQKASERRFRVSTAWLALGIVAVAAGLVGAWLIAFWAPAVRVDRILASNQGETQHGRLTIRYPLDETLFPPEIAPPTFRWEDSRDDVDGWLVTFRFQDEKGVMSFGSRAMEWTPSDEQWQVIQRRSVERPVQVAVQGLNQTDPDRILSEASISVSTSQDEVGAPIFFREVNLPFRTAVKDPAAHIRWRFGDISSREPPRIVLEKLPVCGNCHSFSADGSTLAMEVDSGNDKGAYAIAPVEEQIVLEPSKIITWSDYRREDGQKTFGLLCQASPDGRCIVGTVKDRALAVYRDELAFSQLFFLVKGILAIYDRKKQTISALPGADDPRYVQTSATWSPDGKTIVFARSRSEAFDPPSLRNIDSVLVPQNVAEDFLSGGRKFMFDLYRIPFNDGKGGKAEPIAGASNNGMSNYFPKISPDGKWIVFCKAKSFMLLQPDSELYIIPAAGGEARRLRCNTDRMNSWHSWSPNGKWLVFSSKAYSVYTQLFLTHIDSAGRSTPPVVLANFTEENRAANIPEFANMRSDAIKKIHEQFLDETNYFRAGEEFSKQGEYENAIRWYRRALDINPNYAAAHANWGTCLMYQGKLDEAKTHLVRAIELNPDLPEPRCTLGVVLRRQNKLPEAMRSFREALQVKPDFAVAQLHLGTLLLDLGQFDEAMKHLAEAARLDPRDPFAHFNLGAAYGRAGQPDEAAVHFTHAVEQDPGFVPALVHLALIRATSKDDSLRNGEQAVEMATRACELTRHQHPEALHALAAAYADVGRFSDAISTAELAVRLARSGRNEALAQAIQKPLELYKQQQPFRSDSR